MRSQDKVTGKPVVVIHRACVVCGHGKNEHYPEHCEGCLEEPRGC